MKNKRLIKIISLLALATLMISQITVNTFAESKDGVNDIANVTAEQTNGATVETKEKSDSVSEETSNIATASETKQAPSAQTGSPAAPAQKAAKGSAVFAKKAAAKAKDVPETANTVKPGMTQAEIQKIVDTNDTVVFEGGDYKDLKLFLNGSKTIIPKGVVTLKSTTGNESAFTAADNASLTIDGDKNSSLTIDGYNDGIFLKDQVFTLNINENNTLKLINGKMIGDVNHGNGIWTQGHTTFTINAKKGATFVASGNAGSGINAYGNEPWTETEQISQLNFNFNGCKLVDMSGNKGGSGYNSGAGWYVGASFDFKECQEVHIDNNKVDGVMFCSGYKADKAAPSGYVTLSMKSELNIEDCPDFTMNGNGSWGTNGGAVTIKKSKLECSNNAKEPWADVTITSSNLYCYSLKAIDSTIEANNCHTYCGIWVAGKADIENSIITANQNGIDNYGKTNNKGNKNTGGHGIYFGNTAVISGSQITAKENGKAGIVFTNASLSENQSVISNGSAVQTEQNGNNPKCAETGLMYKSGIVLITGKLDCKNSAMLVREKSGNSVSYNNIKEKGSFVLDENMIAAWKASNSYKEGLASDDPRDTKVFGGSLQASLPNMTGTYGNAWNLQKGADEVYAAPINQFKTKLVRFDLHKDINKECVKDTNTFKTYDPNKKEAYDYSFRYNKKGEDLNADASRNAYVWTPASILNYDATEGTIDQTGTAGEVTYGSSATSKGDAAKGKRFTSDITIFGNSLDLAEKTMPTAGKDGLVFLGWYYADDEEKAAEYAAKEDFINLYDLLNTEFTSASKVTEGKSDDPAKGVEKKTIYAKWMSEEQYYRTGQIAIEKKVTENGQPYQVNATFYAGLFEDAGCTVPTTDADGKAIVIPLNLGGGDTVTVTQDDIPLGTHYVAETDKDGKVVRSSEGHSVKVDNAEVKIEGSQTDAPTVKVTIINDYGDYEGYYKEEGGDPGTTVTSSNTTTTTTEEDGAGEAVNGNATQTGDDSSMAPYIAILILAAAIAAAIVVTGRRKKNKK
ncbi:hypothetical protein NE619_07760 [Anaerovorax odorimutans]|uniref:Uncharacterized protein n=1 Tax=Anaerovorax odorimutans TaxID=109327 RepID=A0ABT1RN56_9FIRM|nr:hypothetical protein [Anaerovorax odorimutans]MCQ4636622.1 hypothetical protein [Anaerovorax odorimutans]